MENDALNKLSAAHLEQLNDQQKAAFVMMDEKDQDFFASNFKPGEIATVINRKIEILQRNKAKQARMEQIQASMAKAAAEVPSSPAMDDLSGVLGAVGLGAGVLAGAAISNDTAHWRGVKQDDLINALRAEFANHSETSVTTSGTPNALTTSILLATDKGPVPAVTIQMTTVDDGTEVKVSDLSAESLGDTLTKGGKKIINLAADGLKLLGKKSFLGGVSADEVLGTASHALDESSGLGELAGRLKIKERAWKAMKAAADSIEKNYLTELEKKRQEQHKTEAELRYYATCEFCGKTFGEDDIVCTGCGQARPPKPQAS